MLVTISNDIIRDLPTLNTDQTSEGRRKNFYEVIRVYADAKQLSEMIF